MTREAQNARTVYQYETMLYLHTLLEGNNVFICAHSAGYLSVAILTV